MAEAVRGELIVAAEREVVVAKAIHDPVAAGNWLTRPFQLWRNHDPALFDQVFRDFMPALPTAADAVFYTAAGVVAGFLVFECLRWPVIVLITGAPRRKFRRKG
jgi:hypothetical protein